MVSYQQLLQHILTTGSEKTDRTGTGTISIFGYQMRFDLTGGFPMVTTKKLHLKSIIHELLWFLKGDTNIKYLNDNGVHIWDEWARIDGDLGPVYGKQWRSWEGANNETIDQISNVINRLNTNPDCRRLIVSAWNVADLNKMALAPCHCLFQFNTRLIPADVVYEMAGVMYDDWKHDKNISLEGLYELGYPKYYLDCQLYQRSADVFLGVPFNIASYALLTMMIAQVVNMVPGDFIHTFGDVHIYKNHIEQVKEQLSRKPFFMPQIQINKSVTNIFDFKYDDFVLVNYNHHPAIKAQVAV